MTKISNLTDGTALEDTDNIPVERSGSTFRVRAILPAIPRDPEDATDGGVDAYASETTTSTPADTAVIVRDFQSANTTTAPTLDSVTITRKDGSALIAGELNGVQLLQYDSAGSTYRKVDETITAERVYAATISIDRADGGIQTLTLTANSTLSVTISEGQSLTLHLSGGDTYTVTWPTMTWAGGSAPTLTATDVIEFWKVGTTLYGAYVGSIA